jgi:hypothetical protein
VDHSYFSHITKSTKKKKKKPLILVAHNLGLQFPSEKKQRGLAKAGSQLKV